MPVAARQLETWLRSGGVASSGVRRCLPFACLRVLRPFCPLPLCLSPAKVGNGGCYWRGVGKSRSGSWGEPGVAKLGQGTAGRPGEAPLR